MFTLSLILETKLTKLLRFKVIDRSLYNLMV